MATKVCTTMCTNICTNLYMNVCTKICTNIRVRIYVLSRPHLATCWVNGWCIDYIDYIDCIDCVDCIEYIEYRYPKRVSYVLLSNYTANISRNMLTGSMVLGPSGPTTRAMVAMMD